MSSGEFYFLSNCPSVHLDLHDVRLLLSLPQQLHLWNERITQSTSYRAGSTNLSVSQDSNDSTVLLDVGQILVDFLLSHRILPLLCILSESLLLGLVPVTNENLWSLRNLITGKIRGRFKELIECYTHSSGTIQGRITRGREW